MGYGQGYNAKDEGQWLERMMKLNEGHDMDERGVNMDEDVVELRKRAGRFMMTGRVSRGKLLKMKSCF